MIDPQKRLLYIADRENYRIQVMAMDSNHIIKQFSLAGAKIKPYGIDFSPLNGKSYYYCLKNDVINGIKVCQLFI